MRLLLSLIFISFLHVSAADELLGKQAEAVLNSVVYRMPSPSIIGKREWKELQLDRLITILDRTKTSFGRWGLVKLLHPITNKHQLQQRKNIITFLLDHPDTMDLFQKQLEQVRRVEKSLLSYWDKDDVLNRSSESFYYSSLFGLSALNTSSIALNASTLYEMFYSWKLLLTTLALGGVSGEIYQWVYGDQTEFNLLRGLKAGFTAPLREISPALWQLKDAQTPYTERNYAQAFWGQGSWGDRFAVIYKGYKESGSKVIEGSHKISAFITATVPTLFYYYTWTSMIGSVSQRIIFMNRALSLLQQRVSDVAQGINAIMDLQKLIASQDDDFNDYFDMNNNEYVDLFVKKLLTKRFLHKQNYVYSRGHVLAMHQEIKQIKRSLIPLLHSIALLDAYCSIAQLYKESQNQAITFSFPEFVESSTPLLEYYDAWLPLLSSNDAITNDLILGKAQSKIIITGPNGGGKSTILRTYSVVAVLAQSWGIVPAQRAQQTLLASIRTSLAPHEDLEQGLSTFMAEKKVMTELTDDIRESDATHPVLVLIDEPYKGTVDAESAKRIYQFGKDVADYPYALIGIATHVKKPIMLEHDTGGIFGNYQVKIREISFGVFERLFKLEKGPAMWWFEDSDQRSRFVDWISTKSAVAN